MGGHWRGGHIFHWGRGPLSPVEPLLRITNSFTYLLTYLKTNKNSGLKVRPQYTQLMNTKISVRVRQN